MALGKNSGLFGLKECQIAPVATDVVGSATTYGTVLDVPGIKSLKIDLNVKSVDNRGDEVILDTEENIEYIDVSFENAEVSLDVLAAINGGTVANSGTAETEKNVYLLAGTQTSAYFKLFAKPKRGDSLAGIDDVLFEVFKVRGTLNVTPASDGFASCSFKGKGIRTKGTVDSTAAALYRITYAADTITIV